METIELRLFILTLSQGWKHFISNEFTSFQDGHFVGFIFRNILTVQRSIFIYLVDFNNFFSLQENIFF